MRRAEHEPCSLSPAAPHPRVRRRDLMPTLGFLIEPTTTPAASRATDRALLARAARRGWGTLRLSRFAGDVLGLGRYHVAPAGAPDVALHRRLSGGRAAAAGA